MSVDIVHIIGLNDLGQRLAHYYVHTLQCKTVVLFDNRLISSARGEGLSGDRRDMAYAKKLKGKPGQVQVFLSKSMIYSLPVEPFTFIMLLFCSVCVSGRSPIFLNLRLALLN